MRRLSHSLILLAVAAVSAGCSGTNSVQTPGPEGQDYYFEVQFQNWAWGHRHAGVVIDRDGTVTEWDRTGDPWRPKSYESWTTEELEAKYTANPKRLGTVPPEILQQQIELIEAASLGEFTDRDSRCADAGGTQFDALVYDSETDTYRNVLLRKEGDVHQYNLSEAAQTLFSWLDELTEGRFAGCGRDQDPPE